MEGYAWGVQTLHASPSANGRALHDALNAAISVRRVCGQATRICSHLAHPPHSGVATTRGITRGHRVLGKTHACAHTPPRAGCWQPANEAQGARGSAGGAPHGRAEGKASDPTP